MDDASTDGTARAAEEALTRLGSPSHCRVVVNPENLGLAGTLNKAVGLVRTPYMLTCHLDCRFGREDYVASMLELLAEHPRAAAITGQPAVAHDTPLPFAEKLNVVTNLMDIFPRDSAEELVPVGFAEGRCDAFRVEALREAGLWDTHLRTAGEDQVLAARLRERGYEVYQAPRLVYHLSVSGEQDTVRKLARHQRLFGRAHPYIMVRVQGTRSGVVGRRAGTNRARRALLRISQLASSVAYLLVVLALLDGRATWLWAGALVFVTLAKAVLFGRHLSVVRMSPLELAVFFVVQPALDLSYTVGLFQGLWHLARGDAQGPIT
jgi:cellulose synthase/poly-beta-1,6-N-acetylglucosamine synthase-like glycosyltransferase